ncbi:unnamed protein product [Nippostrongylus brasiliensis]|uniref:IRS-type PTB domain-containing protein n=1 Tax=Nippostrongylus brasiliensis TaxID=27835 RepID=A0A0N4XTH1_NIPBR|nr:hypothetical protein Q1695_000433 [Nippostrongylus brasiliensis]VDL69487.1 unnamed protein product [Nippostrongylus brasiliensis]
MEIRDSLCDLGRMEIPRPQFHGMQFVATRGKLGFYKTIRENGSKYGLQVKAQGPRRPVLSNDIFLRPSTVKEETAEEICSPQGKTLMMRPPPSRAPPMNDPERNRTAQKSANSGGLRLQPKGTELEPDYPSDYVPPHLRSHQNNHEHEKTTMF